MPAPFIGQDDNMDKKNAVQPITMVAQRQLFIGYRAT